MFPGENLFGVVGVGGVCRVCCDSEDFSGAATSTARFFRAFAMTFEFSIAFFKVSDGEL